MAAQAQVKESFDKIIKESEELMKELTQYRKEISDDMFNYLKAIIQYQFGYILKKNDALIQEIYSDPDQKKLSNICDNVKFTRQKFNDASRAFKNIDHLRGMYLANYEVYQLKKNAKKIEGDINKLKKEVDEHKDRFNSFLRDN